MPVPNGSNCRAQLPASPDPYDVFLCLVAENILQAPGGEVAMSLARASQAISNGDFGSADIDYFTPTRIAKTFHPRSPGMVAYRDAVLAAMRVVGQI